MYIFWEEKRKKTNKLQVHPYRPVSWLPTHQGIFPDEGETTKQACRDELVVYLFFSSHNIYIYIYIYVCVYNCGKFELYIYIYIIYIYIYV